MSTIRMKVIYENQVTGHRTIELPREAEPIIEQWEQHVGKPFQHFATRGYRAANGRLRFHCGGNYDVIDVDMLGGDGTSHTRKALEELTGHRFTYH